MLVRELRRSDFMFATSTECVESKGVFATNIRTIMSSSYLACHGRAAQCYDKREAKAMSGETLCRNKGSSCQRPSSETQADIFFFTENSAILFLLRSSSCLKYPKTWFPQLDHSFSFVFGRTFMFLLNNHPLFSVPLHAGT